RHFPKIVSKGIRYQSLFNNKINVGVSQFFKTFYMKNLIVYLLPAHLLLIGLTANAQKFSLGFQGGLRTSEFSSADPSAIKLDTKLDSRVGQQAAIFAEFGITKDFSLKPVIEYSSQGGKKLGIQGFATPDFVVAEYPAGQAPQVVYANYNSEVKLNYLMIPLLAKFHWKSPELPLDFYVDGGPFVGFLLSASQVNNGQSQIYANASMQQVVPGGPQSFNNSQNIKNQINPFNIGVESSLGISYYFKSSRLFIEGGANFGLMDVEKSDINGKNESSSTVFAIGYAFLFGK